jgi:hypothetical protein
MKLAEYCHSSIITESLFRTVGSTKELKKISALINLSSWSKFNEYVKGSYYVFILNQMNNP